MRSFVVRSSPRSLAARTWAAALMAVVMVAAPIRVGAEVGPSRTGDSAHTDGLAKLAAYATCAIGIAFGGPWSIGAWVGCVRTLLQEIESIKR